MFSGLWLSPGHHTIELHYETPGLLYGLCLSAAGLLLFIFWMILSHRSGKRRRTESEGVSEDEGPVEDAGGSESAEGDEPAPAAADDEPAAVNDEPAPAAADESNNRSEDVVMSEEDNNAN